ncbi:MAG: hypothetical protein ABI912_04130 [Actinomycetota bacterium]
MLVGSGAARPPAVGDRYVWVAQWESGDLIRVDASTGRRTLSLHIADSRTGPYAIATTRDAVWLMVYQAQQVWKIDPRTGKVLARIHVPFDFEGAIAAYGENVWVECCQQGRKIEVLRIDASTSSIAGRIHVQWPSQDVPFALGAGPAGVWIRDYASIRRIDSPGGISKTITIPLAYRSDRPSLAVGSAGVWLNSDSNLVRYDPAKRKYTDYPALPVEVGTPFAVRNGRVWAAIGTSVVEAEESTGFLLREYHTNRLGGLAAGPAGLWGLTQDSLVSFPTRALPGVQTPIPAFGIGQPVA